MDTLRVFVWLKKSKGMKKMFIMMILLCNVFDEMKIFRSWDTVNTLCISIRRMVELDTLVHYCYCHLLHSLVDSIMYGC